MSSKKKSRRHTLGLDSNFESLTSLTTGQQTVQPAHFLAKLSMILLVRIMSSKGSLYLFSVRFNADLYLFMEPISSVNLLTSQGLLGAPGDLKSAHPLF